MSGNKDEALNSLIGCFVRPVVKPSRGQARIKKNKRQNDRVLPEMYRMGFVYLCLVTVQTSSFIYLHGLNYWLIVTAIPLGIVFGIVLYALHQYVIQIRNFFYAKAGKVLAGFVLFFIYLLSYILIFSVVVSYPVGWLFELISEQSGVSRDFELYSINFIIIFSIMSWLDWLRTKVLLRK